jgi:hypothetical protein
MACSAPPRTWNELSDLLKFPAIGTPAATTGGQTLPKGIPATPAEAEAMEQIVRQWLACQNAGEPLRAWAFFSDGYLYRLLSRQSGLSEEAYADMATPTAESGEVAVVLEITGQRRLPDGRLGAMVEISYPSVPMPKRFFFYFTGNERRLEIDGILGEISFSVP